jgi:hypothetical protein
VRVRRTQARPERDQRGAGGVVQEEPRRLQGAAPRGVRGIAEDQHGEDTEIQIAGDGEGGVTTHMEQKSQPLMSIVIPPSPTLRGGPGRPPIGERRMTKAEYRKRARERERERRPRLRDEWRELALASGNAIPIEEGRHKDRGQSDTARAIEQGASHLLRQDRFLVLRQLILPSGKCPDLVAIRRNGEIWIVEIKSSREDFRSDRKWPEYHDYCHRMFFATTPTLPDIFPQDVGLIQANCFGGKIVRVQRRHRIYAAHKMRACINDRIVLMARQKQILGKDYDGFVRLTQQEIKPKLLGEWFTLPPQQRRTIHQAKIFAKDAKERYLFQSRTDRYALILRWICPFIGQ